MRGQNGLVLVQPLRGRAPLVEGVERGVAPHAPRDETACSKRIRSNNIPKAIQLADQIVAVVQEVDPAGRSLLPGPKPVRAVARRHHRSHAHQAVLRVVGHRCAHIRRRIPVPVVDEAPRGELVIRVVRARQNSSERSPIYPAFSLNRLQKA